MKCRKSTEKGEQAYCRSPIACGAFGYCRERNFDFPGGSPINPETVKKWQEEDKE